MNVDEAELEALALEIRGLLAAIEASELSASAPMKYRLEGALTAIEAILREPSSLLRSIRP